MRTLYHFWQCPYCVRTRVVLDEKGLDYESVEVDLKNKPQALLDRNPRGKVPVLEDDGVVLYESHIINEYLEELHPEPRLMPEAPVDRARVRLLHDWCDKDLAPVTYALVKELLLKDNAEDRDEDVIRYSRSRLKTMFDRLDRELSNGGFLLGEFGLADITLAPWVVGLGRLGVPADDVPPRVTAWIERLQMRPSIARHTGEKEAV